MQAIDSIWQITPATAHPRARELLTMPGFWDWGDEDSPLGNDTGADTFAAYLEHRRTQPAGTIEQFIQHELAIFGLPSGGPDAPDDEVRLWQAIAEGKGQQIIIWDDFIVALAVAQLVLQGNVEPGVKHWAMFALRRESTDAILQFRGGDGVEGRRQQLSQFQQVLESV